MRSASTAPCSTATTTRPDSADGRYLPYRTWQASGLTVGRSGAYAGMQDVVVIYYLQRIVNGSWVTWASQTYSGRMSGAGTVTFPRWVFNPSSQPSYRNSYRVVYGLAWAVAGSSQVLGNGVIVPSTTGDNRCVIAFGTPCQAYWDGIVF